MPASRFAAAAAHIVLEIVATQELVEFALTFSELQSSCLSATKLCPRGTSALLKRARMRPHFDVVLADDGRNVFAALQKRLQQPTAPFIGDVLSTHAYLRMPRDARTLLSPNLNLELVEEGDHVVLRGRFTPHPSVWMGFVAVFFTLAMVGIGGLMYGFAQLTVEEAPWAMLAAPVCFALIAFVYGAAFVAQGLVQDEMYTMRAWVERLANRDA